jgi:hypothetical protein
MIEARDAIRKLTSASVDPELTREALVRLDTAAQPASKDGKESP